MSRVLVAGSTGYSQDPGVQISAGPKSGAEPESTAGNLPRNGVEEAAARNGRGRNPWTPTAQRLTNRKEEP